LSLEDVFVLPAIRPELIEASPEMRKLAEEHARKLKVLPPEVKAAVARANEIGDVLLDAQTQLAFILLEQGRPIAEIATRSGLNEDDVSCFCGELVRIELNGSRQVSSNLSGTPSASCPTSPHPAAASSSACGR
jgi:hypothetical protein